MMDSRVSVSGSIPDGCASTNEPLKSTTARVPAETWFASCGRLMKNISFTPFIGRNGVFGVDPRVVDDQVLQNYVGPSVGVDR